MLTNKKKLIKKHQLGGPIAKLSQSSESKSLPNGQSVLEWVWDKVSNPGEYASRGLDWVIGVVDPNITAREAVDRGIEQREYYSQPHYDIAETSEGEYIPVVTYLPPQGGIAPLPTLPSGAPGRLVEAHQKLVPLWKNARLREYQFASGIGTKKGTPLELTKSWLKYLRGLQDYTDELTYMDIVPREAAIFTDKTKRLKDSEGYRRLVYRLGQETKPMFGKKKANYKSAEYMADGDGRHVGYVGRIAQKHYDYVDDLINKYSPDLHKRMARYSANLSATKDPKLQELILQTMNLARLLYLRKYPSYLKNVLKLYQHLEAKLGHILDKQMQNMK